MLAPTHAVVDLSRLRANVAAVRERAGEQGVLAAVKADAYGHGAVEVSRFLAREGLVDALGVATVPEGLALRVAGIDLPVLKLSPVVDPDEALAAVEADIATACVSADNASLLADAARAAGRDAVVHLKVDTGMRRVGAGAEDAADLAACADGLGLRIDGIFTHLPVADDPAQDAFTRDQIALFREVVDAVHARLGRTLPHVHLANSAGVLAHEADFTTMVRPGIMLYGYHPDAATPRTVHLEPVLQWRSRVSFVKNVQPGESVGYGRTWYASEPTTVATVPVGYADGYPRLLSSRAEVLVAGRRCRVVGRVCMDQLMVAVPPSTQVGDDVVLLGCDGGEQVGADELALLAGTISYEVLCGISGRVPRVYTS